jgi:transcriptional regulator with GAF, ATPase, and Fis domain/CHASE2 domain-containing sensor protein
MELKTSKIHHRNLIILLFIGIIFCMLSAIPFPWNKPISNALIDIQFKIRGSRHLSDKIVLVYMGDDDIKAINKDKGWPITRDYYGYMVYIFNHFGAKVIGIDVLFSTEDRFYPEYDAIFVDALHSSGNVCLPMTFSELSYDHQNTARLPSHFPVGHSPAFPIQLFQDKAAGIGFSNFDQGRIIRKAPLVVALRDTFVLSFGCELARLYLGVKDSINFFSDEIQMTDTTGKQYDFPINQNGKLRLNHFGNIQDLSSMSLVDLLKTYETNPDTLNFKDKIVFVAVTAPGVMKVASTPLSSVLPATLIHATVLENLIDQNYLKEIPIFSHWIIIILLVVSAWLLFRLKQKVYLVAGILGGLFVYWIIVIIGFSFGNWIIPLFYPTLAFLTIITYLEIKRNIERRLEEYALKVLLNDQIRTKESQLDAARTKLAEVQSKLSEETIITEQTKQLAAERENTIHKLEKELRDLQTYIIPTKQKLEFAEIIYAENSKMADVLELVATVSRDDIPVLIMGETGTGKEMIARAIHNSSKRKKAAFVAINCGALSETLLESELFGHEKGSFTGAHSRRRGRFELADGGTIFLDEITETSPAFQTRLLRVLQEASFERLGGEQTIKVDVRIIAATNKDVQVEMENNRFRADLFYRLNGFPITIPPLRERQNDVPLLAFNFLKKYNYTSIKNFSDRAMEILKTYSWQGNVRELENIIRRAAILAQSEKRNIIRESDLPEEILKSKPNQTIQPAYKPLEDQILDMLRTFEFTRSAISQTAKSLGNRDRGTITEYFRGICFENLANAEFDIELAAKSISNSTDTEIIDRVKTKINEYLNNLQLLATDLNSKELKVDDLPSAFKGLPKKYHSYLEKVIENLGKILPLK